MSCLSSVKKPLFSVENGFSTIVKLEENHTSGSSFRINCLKAHIGELKEAVILGSADLMGYTPRDCIEHSLFYHRQANSFSSFF